MKLYIRAIRIKRVSVGEASGGANLRFAGPEGTPLVYGTGVSRYTFQSWVTQATDVMLRATPTTYPPDITGTYLQLPSSLPRRVRDLTQRRVVGDTATPFDKAVRIQDYLRLRRILSLAGLKTPASTTSAEYLHSRGPALSGRGRLPDVLAQATQLYQQTVFSSRPPTCEVDLARQQAGRGWSDFGRIFVARFWQLLRGNRW